MITVNILINGQPIYTRTAVNRVKETGFYINDDGSKISHNPDDGAVALAIKMLKTIKAQPLPNNKEIFFKKDLPTVLSNLDAANNNKKVPPQKDGISDSIVADYSSELDKMFTDIYFNAQTTDTELNKAVLEAINRAKAKLEALLRRVELQALAKVHVQARDVHNIDVLEHFVNKWIIELEGEK